MAGMTTRARDVPRSARDVSRAVSRGTCPAQFQKGFQKGQRHDWTAFKVPGEFSDVFWGQSCRARDASRAMVLVMMMTRQICWIARNETLELLGQPDIEPWRLPVVTRLLEASDSDAGVAIT